MAKCIRCKKEMCAESTTTCEGNCMVKFPDGAEMEPIPFSPPDPTIRCHDCNVTAGGCHHVGCDMELCPRCGGQLLGCSCLVSVRTNDEEMKYDLLSAADAIFELGMDLCLDTGDVPYAAVFFSPKGPYIEDKFNFTDKIEAMKFIRKMIVYHQAQIVVLLFKYPKDKIDELPPGFSIGKNEIMCIYAEDKYESYGVIVEYWRGDDGNIEFGDEFEFPEGKTVGQLSGFLNSNIRLK
jgi:hypothetical protein